MGVGGGMAGYAGTTRTRPRTNVTPNPRWQPNIVNQALDLTSQRPGSAGSSTAWTGLDPARANELRNQNPAEYVRLTQQFQGALGNSGYPVNQPMYWANRGGGSSGGGRGGGGGGGGGPAGLDQATLDWLMAQLKNRPQGVTYRDLDLPDPSQYMRWDPAQFNLARQGVESGIAGIRGRGNTAIDAAIGELNRYQNPFAGQLQQINPDLYAKLGRTAQQTGAQQALGQTYDEGVQADRAMSNQLAMLAANDQARQAANLRAMEGDRRTMEQNLGIEGNMLNLGVNMAEARGKTAFDQRLQDAMLQAAQQEAMQNYARRNEVESTNAATYNDWLQNTLQQVLGLVGQRAPGTALPGDMSWLSAAFPGGMIQAGSQPIPPAV